MKKKRLLSLALAVTMLFGSAAAMPEGVFETSSTITASAWSNVSGFYTYEVLDDGTAEITKYSGTIDEEITIPSTIGGRKVTSIGCRAFRDNSFFISVTIPSGVTKIADYAFDNCNNFTSVNISSGVTSIGYNAFGCRNLTSINVDSKNKNYSSVDGVLYNNNKTALIMCPRGKTSLVIPSSVTSIEPSAFAGCLLKNITIPNSVTSIGQGAFRSSGITSIIIPNSVTSIEFATFEWCSDLKSVTIPNSVKSISRYAFIYCESLESITIPSSVKSIGDEAFEYCENLENITIQNGVTSIGYNAFDFCSSLTSVTIPSSVKSIGEGAFNRCSSLKSVTIPSSVTSIGDKAFGYDQKGEDYKIEDFKIYCYKDSAGEKYAKENGIQYEYIDETEEPESQPTSTTVRFKYDGKNYSFHYNDDWLTNEPKAEVENGQIAMFSSNLAIAAYEKDNIKQCLEKMGFKSNNIKNIDTYKFMPTYEDNDRVAYTIAYKKVNGKDLFVVPIRGTHGNCEWFSDFNLGTGDDTEGYHKGFYLAANSVKATLLSEMKNRNVKSENVVLFFTGHSRGAAVANILGGEFSTNKETGGYAIPSNQIFAYTYACPAVSKTLTSKDTALKNIYNYINPGDLIPALPLEEKGWDYKRYGQKIPYSLSGDTFYDFLHRFYEFYRNEDGEKEYYKGLAKTDQVIAVFKTIASTPKEYNKPNNRALFDILCLNLMKDGSKYIPSTKDELKEQIAKRYNTSISTLVESTSKLMGAIGMIASPQMAFNGITLFNLGDAITHGHTGETYVKWTEAMYDTRTNLSHEYDPVKTGFWVGLGYSSYRCKICGKENVINYQPAAVENVVKNVEKDLNLTFHRCDEDEKTYGLFKSVEVDGKTVDPSNYSTKSGSLKLTFDKSFVSKLSAGTHSVKVLFEDGFSETNIFVAESSKDPMVDRLAGKGRYETAAKISNKAYGFETASTVVLAYGLNYADALAGVSLAKAMNAPILLTNLKTLPNETLVEIKRLGASNVIILGGTGAVGEEVEKILKENNLNIERIAGKTRFETATKIAGKMQALNDNKACEDIFFVYAFNSADALSVSAVAAVKGAPVIYLKTNGELDDATANYLKSVKGSVKNAYVIGGSGVISDDMMKKAGKALDVTPTRVFGKDRFATCVAVNEKFADVLDGDSICVATGMDFPDALAGGVYAAINKAPLFLVNGKLKTPKLTDEQKAYLKAKSAAKITAFGGVGVVPDNHIADIAKNSV